jgi:hypothetical protein
VKYRFKSVLILAITLGLCFQSLGADALFGPEFEFRSKNRGGLDLGCLLSYPAAIAGIQLAFDNGRDYENFTDDPAFISYVIAPVAVPMFAAVCSQQVSKLQAGQLARAIKKKCEFFGCTVSLKNHQTSHLSSPKQVHRVEFPDGWYFNIDADVTAVEISAKPLSESAWKEKQGLLKSVLYDTAEETGLKVPTWDRLSGGHISIGYQSVFEGNPLLFRNFIVDQINHVELSAGIHLYDPFNAKPLSFEPSVLRKLQIVLDDFDAGKLPNEEEFIKKVYKAIKGASAMDTSTLAKDKFKASAKRVEVRAHRSQKSPQEFVDLIALYNKRLDYLKNLDEPLVLESNPKKLPPEEMLKRYRTYLEEAGADYEVYKEHLPDWLKAESKRLYGTSPANCYQKALSNAVKAPF